jgi:sugar-phosphatase
MAIRAVIFDMDGLLIDSEPLWQEAGAELLGQYGVTLTDEQYHSSTGLRTPEWTDHWFRHFQLDPSGIPGAIQSIEQTAIDKITDRGQAMPGVEHVAALFQVGGYSIGLASSSPMRLIDVVIKKLNLAPYLQAVVSAEQLPYGKPHPQVFIDCAAVLGVAPAECLVFEDSFNGMISAKAAKMKCIVVPAAVSFDEAKWAAADARLRSLADFTMEMLQGF